MPRPTGRSMPTSCTATLTAFGTSEGALPLAASWRAARCAAFAAFSARLRSPRVATSCAAGEASKSDASCRAASKSRPFVDALQLQGVDATPRGVAVKVVLGFSELRVEGVGVGTTGFGVDPTKLQL